MATKTTPTTRLMIQNAVSVASAMPLTIVE